MLSVLRIGKYDLRAWCGEWASYSPQGAVSDSHCLSHRLDVLFMPADTIAPASAAETPRPLTLRTRDLHNDVGAMERVPMATEP
jgi:hypothetical protein